MRGPSLDGALIVADTGVMPRFVRASDAERDKALALLRDGVASGRLSDSTFIRRVDLTLRARTRGEVHRAVADLPAATTPVAAFLHRLGARLPRFELARPPGRIPGRVPVEVLGLHLPGGDGQAVRIGRSLSSDLRLADETVSRMHAVLAHTGPGAWTLTDLASMNGTFLNGARVAGTVEVRHGDLVRFGTVPYRLQAR
jgi:hypothetical protein